MTPDRADIDAHVSRILQAPSLASAPSLRALLIYLVEATLSGEADRLKGYAIGVDVFQRGADFDPQTDPIVRVQAGRLRKALQEYYFTDGAEEPLRLTIPKGAYRIEFIAPGTQSDKDPEFSDMPTRWQPWGWRIAGLGVLALALAVGVLAAIVALTGPNHSLLTNVIAPSRAPEPPSPLITVAMLPLADRTAERGEAVLAEQLTEGLAAALSRVNAFWVVAPGISARFGADANPEEVYRQLGVKFLLSGGVQTNNAERSVTINLVDAARGHQVWGQRFALPSPGNSVALDSVVADIMAELRARLFAAAKGLTTGNATPDPAAWRLYLESVWVPSDARSSLAFENERIALARQALALDPDFGQAHGVLAEKLASLGEIDPPSDTMTLRTEAQYHALRAVELAGSDPDVMFNVALYAWHAGNLDEAEQALRRTLDLDPNNVLARFLTSVLPYACAPPPQEIVAQLQARDAALSPDNPVRWVLLAWISMLSINRGDWDTALTAAQQGVNMRSSPEAVLRYAALLNRAGRTEQAVAAVAGERANWPNLDPRHFADTTIARRCAGKARIAELQGIYGDLARTVEREGS